jgi:hypothetical protein
MVSACCKKLDLEFGEAASLSVRKTEKLIAQFLDPAASDSFVEPGR